MPENLLYLAFSFFPPKREPSHLDLLCSRTELARHYLLVLLNSLLIILNSRQALLGMQTAIISVHTDFLINSRTFRNTFFAQQSITCVRRMSIPTPAFEALPAQQDAYPSAVDVPRPAKVIVRNSTGSCGGSSSPV